MNLSQKKAYLSEGHFSLKRNKMARPDLEEFNEEAKAGGYGEEIWCEDCQDFYIVDPFIFDNKNDADYHICPGCDGEIERRS